MKLKFNQDLISRRVKELTITVSSEKDVIDWLTLQLSNAAGKPVTRTVVTNWFYAGSFPNPKNQYRLSKILQISPEDIILQEQEDLNQEEQKQLSASAI